MSGHSLGHRAESSPRRQQDEIADACATDLSAVAYDEMLAHHSANAAAPFRQAAAAAEVLFPSRAASSALMQRQDDDAQE